LDGEALRVELKPKDAPAGLLSNLVLTPTARTFEPRKLDFSYAGSPHSIPDVTMHETNTRAAIFQSLDSDRLHVVGN
jgi:hypothetical protein